MDAKDPFGYPWEQYTQVVGLAATAGLIKYLNAVEKKSWLRAGVSAMTCGFTGVMTFWLCEAITLRGPMSAVLIATSGLMGASAWREFENLWRLRFGLPQNTTNKDEAPK